MFGRVINVVDHDFLYLDQDASLNILLMKISHVSLSLFCIIEFTVFYLASLVIKFIFFPNMEFSSVVHKIQPMIS